MREFCWYPYIDSTDWDTLVREPRRAIDPQGVYWLCDAFHRRPSELSHLYAALARGEIGAAEIPAYQFEDAVLDGRGKRVEFTRSADGQARAGHVYERPVQPLPR